MVNIAELCARYNQRSNKALQRATAKAAEMARLVSSLVYRKTHKQNENDWYL